MPGMGAPTEIVTPGRTTQLVLDPNERIMNRAPFRHQKNADHVHRYQYRATTGQPQNIARSQGHSLTQLVPAPGWMMNPLQGEFAQVLSQNFSGSPIPESGLMLPPMFKKTRMWKPNILGIDTPPLYDRARAVIKRVPTGQSWGGGNNILIDDQNAFPAPLNPTTQQIPMDRVMVSNLTFVENAGFGIMFGLNQNWYGSDAFMTFYFGGPADVRQYRNNWVPDGGEFCIMFRGNGTATLYERYGSFWEMRHEFRWAQPNRANDGWLGVGILPYMTDKILITSQVSDTAISTSDFPNISAAFARPGDPTRTYYRESPTVAGHVHVRSMTGRGPIRLDVRRDFRQPWQIVRLVYPNTSVLVDEPFFIETPLPAGTPIHVDTFGYFKLGGLVQTQLYNAANETALVKNADGDFLSVALQQHYYAAFTFTPGDSGLIYRPSPLEYMRNDVTPVLESYRITVPGVYSNRTGGAITGGNIRRVSITGPGLTYDEDTGAVDLKDPGNVFTRLRRRGRIHAQIRCLTSRDVRGYTILHEGEIPEPDNVRRGKVKKEGAFQAGATSNYPSSEWRDFDLKLVGMAARLKDQFIFGIFDFNLDPDAPDNPTLAEKAPYKVTDAIKILLEQGGFPENDDNNLTMVDIPDDLTRFWKDASSKAEDTLLVTGASIGVTAQKYALFFLGRPLVWDANVGTYGKWRLLDNPQKPAAGWASYPNVVAEFRYEGPTGSNPRIRYREGAYGSTAITWIDTDSFRTYVHAPEFNFLIVTSTGDLLPGGQGVEKLVQGWHNPNSFDIDPNNPTATDVEHPDYLGRFVPCIVVDPNLTTPEAVSGALRRLSDFAGHGEKWVKWRSPLILMNDTLDADPSCIGRVRPIRINDVVKVAGLVAIVKSCNPDYTHSKKMMAEYHAKFME